MLRNPSLSFGEPRWGRTNDHLIKSLVISHFPPVSIAFNHTYKIM